MRFIFYKDEFIMHIEIWMSQICHAHNCRAVQKMKRTQQYAVRVLLPLDLLFSEIRGNSENTLPASSRRNAKRWNTRAPGSAGIAGVRASRGALRAGDAITAGANAAI